MPGTRNFCCCSEPRRAFLWQLQPLLPSFFSDIFCLSCQISPVPSPLVQPSHPHFHTAPWQRHWCSAQPLSFSISFFPWLLFQSCSSLWPSLRVPGFWPTAALGGCLQAAWWSSPWYVWLLPGAGSRPELQLTHLLPLWSRLPIPLLILGSIEPCVLSTISFQASSFLCCFTAAHLFIVNKRLFSVDCLSNGALTRCYWFIQKCSKTSVCFILRIIWEVKMQNTSWSILNRGDMKVANWKIRRTDPSLSLPRKLSSCFKFLCLLQKQKIRKATCLSSSCAKEGTKDFHVQT